MYNRTEPEPMPNCPMCGSEVEELYENDDNDIIGCPSCIRKVNAFEWEACERDNREQYERGERDAQRELQDDIRRELK